MLQATFSNSTVAVPLNFKNPFVIRKRRTCFASQHRHYGIFNNAFFLLSATSFAAFVLLGEAVLTGTFLSKAAFLCFVPEAANCWLIGEDASVYSSLLYGSLEANSSRSFINIQELGAPLFIFIKANLPC